MPPGKSGGGISDLRLWGCGCRRERRLRECTVAGWLEGMMVCLESMVWGW